MRYILLPFLAVLELICLGFCWVLAFVKPSWAEKVKPWCMNKFPDREWYSGGTWHTDDIQS